VRRSKRPGPPTCAAQQTEREDDKREKDDFSFPFSLKFVELGEEIKEDTSKMRAIKMLTLHQSLNIKSAFAHK
jgi:hypothetical protein